MTEMSSNEVWLEGSAARAYGKSISANPYSEGSQESDDWLQGYKTIEAEQLVASADAGEHL